MAETQYKPIGTMFDATPLVPDKRCANRLSDTSSNQTDLARELADEVKHLAAPLELLGARPRLRVHVSPLLPVPPETRFIPQIMRTAARPQAAHGDGGAGVGGSGAGRPGVFVR